MNHPFVIAAVIAFSSFALAQAAPAAPPTPPVPPAPPALGVQTWNPDLGIPPDVARRVGLSPEVTRKVRDLSFEANDALITLEADLKRAQLELEKSLTATQVDEAAVMSRLEVVSRAELAVRKNRMGLLVRIKKLLGPDAWDRLQAELPLGDEAMVLMPGPRRVQREVRIIKNGDKVEQVDIRGP